MRQLYQRITLMTALVASSLSAFAVPFNSFDPRSMAMGGVGVAIGDPSTAPFFNPALLSASDRRKKFALELPIIGMRLYDPGDLWKNTPTLKDTTSSLQTLIDAANAAPSSATLTAAVNSIATINALLASLSNQPLQTEFGLATVVSMPGKNLGMAVYGSAWSVLGGTLEYNDATMVSDFTSAVSACAAQLALTQLCAAGNAYVSTTGAITTPTFTSKIHVRGIAIGETGVSLSHGFVSADRRFSIGITPKIMRIYMLDASLDTNAGNLDGISGSDYLTEYNNLNADVGMTKNFPGGFRTALVVKNVIPRVYDFKSAPTSGATPVANGTKLTLRPLVRAGVAYEIPLFTIAVDADLTKNDPAGLENYSQYVAIGIEVGVSEWTQLRFGYRNDMLDKTRRNIVSAGVGISPRLPFFKPHFDLAVTASPNLLRDGYEQVNEVGLAFRFGFNF